MMMGSMAKRIGYCHVDVEVLQLPPNIRLTYQAEGAANIVFKIAFDDVVFSFPNGISSPSVIEGSKVDSYTPKANREDFRGRLLRLRKDVFHATSPLQSQRDFDRYIVPFFESAELVQSRAVEVDASLICQLNNQLQAQEQAGTRAGNRHGIYLKQETHATIVSDVGHGLDDKGFVFEIKPKWLLQSPDAPETARRCRTCALRASRTVLGVKNGFGPRWKGFCPLDLVSRDRNRIAKALEHPFKNTKLSGTAREHIIDYLTHSELLQKLRGIQKSLHNVGVLHIDPYDMDFLTLMTIRDCSLFLTVTDDAGVTSARLGDLDMKSAIRAAHWREMEQELIDGEWYEKPLEGAGYIPCSLERDE